MDGAVGLICLIKGSHAIDRMKQEITEILAILSSLLPTDLNPKRAWISEYESGNFQWRVERYRTRVENPSFAVFNLRIKRSLPMPPHSFFEEIFSTHPECSGLSMANTQGVYEAIPCLIEALAEEFPLLVEKMAPIIRASSVF